MGVSKRLFQAIGNRLPRIGTQSASTKRIAREHMNVGLALSRQRGLVKTEVFEMGVLERHCGFPVRRINALKKGGPLS